MLEELGLERDVLQPVVTIGKDHLRFDLPPAGNVLALKRSIIVPFSTIRDVTVDAPPWPSALHLQRLGTFVPGVACLGTFWLRRGRAFFFFMKGDRVMTLKLDEHPFERLVIGSPEADILAADIKSLLPGSRGSETQSF